MGRTETRKTRRTLKNPPKKKKKTKKMKMNPRKNSRPKRTERLRPSLSPNPSPRQQQNPSLKRKRLILLRKMILVLKRTKKRKKMTNLPHLKRPKADPKAAPLRKQLQLPKRRQLSL